ncbi:MAG: hypothetical protein AAB552_01040 [Patescibacteria group bacterium]
MKNLLISVVVSFLILVARSAHGGASPPKSMDEMFVFTESYLICERQEHHEDGTIGPSEAFIWLSEGVIAFCWGKNDSEEVSVVTTPLVHVKILLDNWIIDPTVTLIFGGKKEIPLQWLQGSYPFHAPLSGIELRVPIEYFNALHRAK